MIPHVRGAAAALGVILLVACGGWRVSLAPAAGWPAELIAGNERGVALMGQHKFGEALAVFDSLAERFPEVDVVTVNRGLATLNRQQKGDEQRALARFEEVLARSPDDPCANYGVGLLLLRGGRGEALDRFERARAAAPNDAYVELYRSMALELVGRRDEALAGYREVIARNPYLVSAYYRSAQILLRQGKRDEGRAMLEKFRSLDRNPLRLTSDWVYGRMGPMAEAISLTGGALTARPVGPLLDRARPFAADEPRVVPAAAQPAPGGIRPLGATAADLDSDGVVDLVLLPGMTLDGQGEGTVVAVRADDGAFRVEADHPLAGIRRVRTALWGDCDDDGLLDVYLCRRGGNLQLRGTEDGGWEDVTDASGTAGGDHDTVDGELVDADHDGDLDIFCVNADGPDELFNNDRTGSFRPIAVASGIDGGEAASRGVLFADLDADRDVDLIVLGDRPPHGVWRNELTWRWEKAVGLAELAATPAVAVAAADLDGDGWTDLVTLSPDGALLRWVRGRDGTWSVAQRTVAVEGADGAAARLLGLDLDGDGSLEVMQRTSGGWVVHRFGASGSVSARLRSDDDEPLADAVALLLDPAAGPSLLELPVNGPPRLRAPGPGRWPFAALSFSGESAAGGAKRSNRSGIGTAFVARMGGRAVTGSSYRWASGPGQGSQAIAVGLGGAGAIDHLAVVWSDGVYQSELALPAGEHRLVEEIERQLSSCPVLFAWNGEQLAFVSDLLGVGGLGYLVAPGEYAPPRPWERFLLPSGLAKPLRGRYVLELGEPMEEACYLDSAALVAWDLPAGWDLVLDERMGILGPEPTGAPRFFRTEALPVRAINDRGEDVTAAVSAADRVAVPVGETDPRFVGMLRGRQSLELEFATSLDGSAGEPVLVIDGWLEYPYSQTSFAAWQAGEVYEAPTLEARRGDGTWIVLAEQFGYPAGMPRRMSLGLEGLPEGCDALRLTTNQEIYWDRVAVVWNEPCPGATRRKLPLLEAELSRIGYPQRTTGAQRVPHYDRDRCAPAADMRYLAGHYTRFGDVLPLVRSTDDALAIFGPGEAVRLEFAVPDDDAGPPAGGTRRLVLEAHGWCKDMDLYTDTNETLEPLPGRRENAGPARALQERYNVRWEWGI